MMIMSLSLIIIKIYSEFRHEVPEGYAGIAVLFL
jgi:hypothetical protein